MRRDLGAHLHAQLRVEVRERLVHQQDAAGRARSRDPSPRAGAGRRRAPRGLRSSSSVRPSTPRDLARTRASISAFGELAHPQAEADVLGHVHVRVERVVLEDHRDVALLRRDVVDDRRRRCRIVPSLMSSSPATIRSAVVLPQPDGPTRTTNSPSRDVEVEAAHGAGAVGVDLPDALEGHDAIGLPPARLGPRW